MKNASLIIHALESLIHANINTSRRVFTYHQSIKRALKYLLSIYYTWSCLNMRSKNLIGVCLHGYDYFSNIFSRKTFRLGNCPSWKIARWSCTCRFSSRTKISIFSPIKLVLVHPYFIYISTIGTNTSVHILIWECLTLLKLSSLAKECVNDALLCSIHEPDESCVQANFRV